jgi:predicted RNA-binding Zn ribbon-like protein
LARHPDATGGQTVAPTSTPIPELIGGHVALDLVNTISWRLDNDRRRDNLPDFPALIRWCQRAGLLEGVATRQLLTAASEHPSAAQRALRGARSLREDLHTLLARLVDDADPPDAVMAPRSLHRLLLDAMAHSDLTGSPMRWQLTPQRPADIACLLALQALDLLQTPQLDLIRQCHGVGCGWLFLDRTRSHTRRWCSSRDCGNRDRARRHYARHHDQTSLKPGTATQ